MARGKSILDPTIVDAASLFDASEAIADRVGRAKVTLDYTRLLECLNHLRMRAGWRPGSPNTILLSIDPNSEGQQRFQNMLRHSGFEPDVVHYRDTFVSLPPGRNPNDVVGKPAVSLAPRIAYIAGLISRQVETQFLVVTHSFELFGPLADLRNRLTSGRVGLAYFGSLLDYRWKAAGIFEKSSPLEFFDLDPYGNELLGIELTSREVISSGSQSGLSRY